MKKTELTINDTIMSAMALKFLGDTGAFKRIDLHAAEGRSADAAEIEEITELYSIADQQTVFDAFKTTEAFTHFMVNHVFEGKQYTEKHNVGCGSKPEEEDEVEHGSGGIESVSDMMFKKKTAEAILFLVEENEEIKVELDRLENNIKRMLQIFAAKETEK